MSRGATALLFADAQPQIFFQTGEGAFKGVVVIPVREIGDVIFADFFRQIFAGGQVPTVPFFQRRVIRQQDGKKFACAAKRLVVADKKLSNIPKNIPHEQRTLAAKIPFSNPHFNRRSDFKLLILREKNQLER
jgi:hypothetical protein